MLKSVPKMCITCRHFEKYHCTLDDTYIGYLYCSEPIKCKTYSLSYDYRKGGKFYESRKVDSDAADRCGRAGACNYDDA